MKTFISSIYIIWNKQQKKDKNDQFVIILHNSGTDPLHAVHSLIFLFLETAVRQAWLTNVNNLGSWAAIPTIFNISSWLFQIVASSHW